MRLRHRLTLWYSGVLALVMGAYGGAVYLMFAHALAGSPYGEHELGELRTVLVLGLPIGVGAAALGGHLLARRALAPVGRMAERAGRITADSLDARLELQDPRDELGRLGAAFNEVLTRLEASFAELRRFTADASHELRTPLTALRSVGELALDASRTDEQRRDAIGSMLEEVDRLDRLIHALLTLAREDRGALRLAREHVDLVALATETAELLRPVAEDRSATLTVEAGGSVETVGDRTMLRQVVLNLVHNAIVHGTPGEPITISVRASPDGGETLLEVSDRGPGIAPEHRDRIFDRFYRIDPGRSRALGGAGLGLALARGAVEAHGGRIELRTRPGTGSTFRVVLPGRRATKKGVER